MATGNWWFAFLSLVIVYSTVAQEWPCTVFPNGEKIPHNFDCSQYYVCDDGYKILYSCPWGTYFDEATRQCDIQFPTTGCVSYANPTFCHGANHDFYSDPTDCSRYFECFNGQYYELQCPGGLHFDSKTSVCLDPAKASCTSSEMNHPQESPCFGVSATHVELRPIEDYCSYYFQCSGLSYTIQSCPAGMYFFPLRQMCDFEQFVTCNLNLAGEPIVDGPILPPQTIGPSSDPRCATVSFALLPIQGTCTHYVHCQDGLGYEVECPQGTYFSFNWFGCVAPDRSECVESIPRPTPETPPNGVQSPDCPHTIADGRVLPFPGDCTKYYMCISGIKVEMDCPEGLWWHQELGDCDYPYLSRCIR